MASAARLSESGRCFLKSCDLDFCADDQHEFIALEQFGATDGFERFDAKHVHRFHFRSKAKRPVGWGVYLVGRMTPYRGVRG